MRIVTKLHQIIIIDVLDKIIFLLHTYCSKKSEMYVMINDVFIFNNILIQTVYR
jgi:hypothetical protein